MAAGIGVLLLALAVAAPPPGSSPKRDPAPPETTAEPGSSAKSDAATAPPLPEVERPAPVTTATSADPLHLMHGEITHAGSVRLVPRVSFIGARLGVLVDDTTVFMTIAPKADLILLERRLKIGVEIPLNLQLYSGQRAADAGKGKVGFSGLGTLRKQDYDDKRDFVKILRYLSYGREDDPYFFGVGQLLATTIGNGTAMRRYAANVDINSTKLGAQVGVDFQYGGFELALADVTRGNLFAGLLFARPLYAFVEPPILRSIAVGASWASDQKAPLALRRGPRVGSAALGPVLVDALDVPLVETRPVNIFGVTTETKLAQAETTELKGYLDVSHLTHGGTGVSLGLLWYFSARSDSLLHLLKTRLELRSYGANYQPSYFDVLYEFQKYQYITDPNDPNTPTKLAYISGRRGKQRGGVYVEVSYALVDTVVFAIAFETDTAGEDRNLMLHAELPLRYLDLFATYQQRSLAKLFTFDENDVFFAGARIKILPILFIDGRVQKNFVWDRARFSGLGGYAEQLNYQGDVEFGFQF